MRHVFSFQRLTGLGVVTVGLLVRWLYVDFETGDYRSALARWYGYLSANGHLAALRDDSFSNYNTPYLVLLALATYLPVPAMIAIKAISVAGDLVLAGAASRIIAIVRPRSTWAPTIAFAAIFLLPTVVMNGAVWGQCDSLYASMCLLSILHLMKDRPWAASAWFGAAFAFKLQAIFLLPALVVVLVLNRHRLWALLAAPATFLACLVPALVAGRGLLSQLMVYPLQITDSSGVGGTVGARSGDAGGMAPGAGAPPGPGVPAGAGAQPAGGAPGDPGFTLNDGQSFTHNAPTPYAWLPPDASVAWKYAGLVLAAAVALSFGVWLLARRRRLDVGQVLLVAATTTLVLPMLLPEMHERYFYLAEVLTLLAAFVDWRYLLPAAGIQFASITTYLNYLLDHAVFPLRIAAGVAVASAIGSAALVVLTLFRRGPTAAAGPASTLPDQTAPHNSSVKEAST